MNWESRAGNLRSIGQNSAKNHNADQKAAILQSYSSRAGGVTALMDMTKAEFWSRLVKTPDDVRNYYRIYYTDYSEELIEALAIRLTDVATLPAGSPEKIEYLQKQQERAKTSMRWDPQEEIKEQRMIGQLEVAMKNIEKLLDDDTKEEAKEDKKKKK